MQDSNPVIQDIRQVKETNMNRVFMAESGKLVELDESEHSSGSLDCDEKAKAMFQGQPGGGQQALVRFATDPMKDVPAKPFWHSLL
jgi:hypothetical protein